MNNTSSLADRFSNQVGHEKTFEENMNCFLPDFFFLSDWSESGKLLKYLKQLDFDADLKIFGTSFWY